MEHLIPILAISFSACSVIAIVMLVTTFFWTKAEALWFRIITSIFAYIATMILWILPALFDGWLSLDFGITLYLFSLLTIAIGTYSIVKAFRIKRRLQELLTGEIDSIKDNPEGFGSKKAVDTTRVYKY